VLGIDPLNFVHNCSPRNTTSPLHRNEIASPECVPINFSLHNKSNKRTESVETTYPHLPIPCLTKPQNMARKKSHTQAILESRILHRYGGKIDLAKLWKEEEDKEADPERMEKLIRQQT